MRNEKTLSLFLVIVMLFGYCATPISNAEQVKRFQSVKDQKKFKTLEQQKNEALESLKIQLKKQGKMHYYQKLKGVIENKYTLNGSNYGIRMKSNNLNNDSYKRIYAPKGGAASYSNEYVDITEVYMTPEDVRKTAANYEYGSTIIGGLISHFFDGSYGLLTLLVGLMYGWQFRQIADKGKGAIFYSCEDKMYLEIINYVMEWDNEPYIVVPPYATVVLKK